MTEFGGCTGYRYENPSTELCHVTFYRRGRDRRNGGPPPRLANRGRGRERNNYRGDRDRERSGFNDRGGFGDRGGFNDVGRYNDRNSYEQNGEEDWDAEMAGGNEMREQRRGDRDRGGFGDRGRGRGRGGFGRPASRGGWVECLVFSLCWWFFFWLIGFSFCLFLESST